MSHDRPRGGGRLRAHATRRLWGRFRERVLVPLPHEAPPPGSIQPMEQAVRGPDPAPWVGPPIQG